MVVVSATVAAYAGSFAGVFVFDDQMAIVGNARLHRLWPPQAVVGTSLRPLLVYSLALNWAWSGLAPWSYHLVNLAIHATAAVVLGGLVRRALQLPCLADRWAGEADRLAWAAALLWAVHPLQTASVTYIVQRGESLAGLFYLLTLYAFLRGATGPRAWRWYGLAVVAQCAGLATKETAVTAPLAVWLGDAVLIAGSARRALRQRAGLYAALFLPLVGAAAGWWYQNPAFWPGAGGGVTPWVYARTQASVVFHYLRLCMWPHRLCLDTPWPLATTWGPALPAAVMVAGLLLLLAWQLRQRRPAALLPALAVLVLAPTSSVVPLPDPVAEHRLYLPLAALTVGAVLGVRGLLRRRPWAGPWPARLAGLGLAAAVVALGWQTWQRNALYHRGADLWADVLAQYPAHPRAHNNIAAHLAEEGDLARAAWHWSEALRLDPEYLEALLNIGAFWVTQGQTEQAAASYRKALRLFPDCARAHHGLGRALAAQGRLDEAAAPLERALTLDPELAVAHADLGALRLRQGRLAEAEAALQAAVRRDPALCEAETNLGAVRLAQGQPGAALPHLERALAQCPGYAPARSALAQAQAAVDSRGAAPVGPTTPAPQPPP